MKHKSGESPFYDARPEAVRAFSVLPILLVTLVFVLITASFGRYSFFGMLPLAAYPLYLTLQANINIKRVLHKLSRLSAFVFFIGVWNIFFDKSTITLFGVTVGAGWLSSATITLKLLLTVSAVLATFSLVGFDAICRILASFGLPAVIVDQFFLFYRYITLITDEARNIIRARLFRGGKISVSQSGNICGPLILRCADRSRRIHGALACRGYAGEIYDEKNTRTDVSFSDRIFAMVWILLFLAVRFDMALVIGDLVLRNVAR